MFTQPVGNARTDLFRETFERAAAIERSKDRRRVCARETGRLQLRAETFGIVIDEGTLHENPNVETGIKRIKTRMTNQAPPCSFLIWAFIQVSGFVNRVSTDVIHVAVVPAALAAKYFLAVPTR
jgi:hypothetical protein